MCVMMDLPCYLFLWLILAVHTLNQHKVSCCLDMLIKEFSQMFAGPGGTLMGTSNANNLDRIRIFNNYQHPSIDQIEDEEDLEGKFDPDDEYADDVDSFERGPENARQRETVSKRFRKIKERQDTGKRNSEMEIRGNHQSLRDGRKLEIVKANANREKIRKFKSRKEPKERKDDELRDTFERLVQTRPHRTQNSLYALEPKTNAYNSKAYQPNRYDDDAEDSMSFQPRDDTKNRLVSGKVNQPIIEMMSNILDTIQLTSKHDFKRAKEKELRDNAREMLQKMHRS